MQQQNARITNVAQAYEVIKEMNLLAQELTLMLHTYTGKNRCARAIARHLRLCSPRTGLHVRSSTPRRVRVCAQPHLTHSRAFFLDIGMQH